MHANVHADRNSWRLPPDETLQVADPKAKKAEVGDEEVSVNLTNPFFQLCCCPAGYDDMLSVLRF